VHALASARAKPLRACASTCARSTVGSSFSRGLLPPPAAADGIGGRRPHHHHAAPKRSAETRAHAVPRPRRQRHAYERAACRCWGGCRRRGKEASCLSLDPCRPNARVPRCALSLARSRPRAQMPARAPVLARACGLPHSVAALIARALESERWGSYGADLLHSCAVWADAPARAVVPPAAPSENGRHSSTATVSPPAAHAGLHALARARLRARAHALRAIWRSMPLQQWHTATVSTHIHIYIYLYIYGHLYTYTYMDSLICIHTCIHAYICMCTHTHVRPVTSGFVRSI
jgi:hypothetical protein